MEDAQAKLNSANNMQEAIGSILNSLTYHLLKKNTKNETQAPIKGEKELIEFKNTTYDFIQNLLIIIQQFKQQFSDTVDPVLLHMYRDNYLWLKNLCIELHRIITPSEPNRDVLSIAKALGVSLNDAPNFDGLRPDDTVYAEYLRCPNPNCPGKIGEDGIILHNEFGASVIICPKCKSKINVPVMSNSDVDTDSSVEDSSDVDTDSGVEEAIVEDNAGEKDGETALPSPTESSTDE